MRPRLIGKRAMLLLAMAAASCSIQGMEPRGDSPYVVVLGIAQDAGFPQAGCRRACCSGAKEKRHVACLAIVEPTTGERWILDATPDFKEQLRALDAIAPPSSGSGLSGIFLTHAHMGHYTGLMHLGREAMGAREVPLHVMPRMADFLSRNGPWDQLLKLSNVSLRRVEDGVPVRLGARLSVTPFLVPHRDEYSETVGYRIEGPSRSVVFIPDIDKWGKWTTPVEQVVAKCSVAYLDGTFFEDGEVAGRSMAEIPHPFISESMKRLASLPREQRARVRFIHLNHTNPALDPSSEARKTIETAGFGTAEEGEQVGL